MKWRHSEMKFTTCLHFKTTTVTNQKKTIMAKGGLDFTKLKSRKTEVPDATPKRMYKEVVRTNVSAGEESTHTPAKAKKTPVKNKPKAPAKPGRKSWKTEGIDYTRMAFDTPLKTKQKLKELLAVKFFGKFISQDEMINAAIDDFIRKHTK